MKYQEYKNHVFMLTKAKIEIKKKIRDDRTR